MPIKVLIVDDSAIVRTQLRNEIRAVAPECQVYECSGVLEAGVVGSESKATLSSTLRCGNSA